MKASGRCWTLRKGPETTNVLHRPVDGPSERNQRPRLPRSCAIEKQPHAQCFPALCRNQAHVPVNVVLATEFCDARLVGIRIALQAGDPFFQGAAKPRADLEAFLRNRTGKHGKYLTEHRS